MKKVFFIPKFCFLLVTCLCLSNCKKDPGEPIDKSNIVLYDKPLSVIQECINGKWELIYAKGGISANNIQYIHNEFWKFNSNKIEMSDSEKIYTNTTIQWIYDLGTFTNGKRTHTINFYDRNNYPHKYIVDGIYNDTLVLGDYAYDGMTYHFIRYN